MSNNMIKSFAKKANKSVDEVEKLWDKAKSITSEDKDFASDSDEYYAYATGILKKMLKLNESTTVTNIPDVPTGPSGKMPCGTPYFNCDHKEDMFWNLHVKARGKGQWFNKHYKDEPVANWARQNKGKSFYLRYQDYIYQ